MPGWDGQYLLLRGSFLLGVVYAPAAPEGALVSGTAGRVQSLGFPG